MKGQAADHDVKLNNSQIVTCLGVPKPDRAVEPDASCLPSGENATVA